MRTTQGNGVMHARIRGAGAVACVAGWSVALCAACAWGQNAGGSLTATSPIDPVKTPAPANSPQASIAPHGLVLPAEFDLATTATIPEGSLINAITGTAVRLSEDMVVFVPDEGQRAGVAPLDAAVPPMVVLPNQRLAQFSSSLAPRGDRARVSLSGEVYTYRGLAHVLLTGYAFEATVVSEEPEASSSTAATPSTASTSAAPASSGDGVDARVQQLMQDLERTAPSRRLLDTPTGDPTMLRSASEDGSLLSERTIITRVRGRLVRLGNADGRYAFAVDNDPDSPAKPPILLVPNAMLEQVENAVANWGESLSFQVSGRVMTCRDKNYLLLVFFQVVQPSEQLSSGQ